MAEVTEKQNKSSVANCFKALQDIYEAGVKDNDKKGFAELYKEATKLLMERVSKEVGIDLHYEDIEYLDGYFIFGHGTNSVVHFHVKEMPGWLCGIWWYPKKAPEYTEENPVYEKDVLSCNLFAQYESEIDKFKPSASTFGGEDRFDVVLAQNEGYLNQGFLSACDDFKFIIKEPELAFYREMTYTDFNHEYVSRQKAKMFMKRHFELKQKQVEIKEINKKEMLKALAHIVGPMIKDGDMFVEDRSEVFTPGYELWLKNVVLDDGKPLVKKEGCYYLMDIGTWPGKKDDEKVWNKAEKECEKRAKKVKDWFSNPCSLFANIRNADEFERVRKFCEKEGSLFNLLDFVEKDNGGKVSDK